MTKEDLRKLLCICNYYSYGRPVKVITIVHNFKVIADRDNTTMSKVIDDLYNTLIPFIHGCYNNRQH